MTAGLFVRAPSGSIRVQVVRHSWYRSPGGSNKVLWTAEGSCEDQADLPAVVADLLDAPGIPRGARRVIVAIGPPAMQVRTLRDIPPVRAQQLQRLVQLQSSRFFRQNGMPLLTAARWIARKEGDRAVLAIAAPADLIDSLAQTTGAAGLVLESVQPDGFDDIPSISLRPARLGSAGLVTRLSLKNLVIAVLGLWLAFGALYAARVTGSRRSMERERAALGEAVSAVRAARREVSNARAMIEAIDADRAEYGRILLTLAALTEALPDSSHITSFAVDNGTGVINGLAKRASAVAASFGRSGVLIEPVIEGQVMKEMVNGAQRDRFALTFRIRR